MPDNHSTTKTRGEFNYGKPLPPLTDKDVARFWANVDKTPGHGPKGECWVWTLGKQKFGYGRFSIKHLSRSAHRVAYVIQSGIDPGPLCVLHDCDFPPCVRGSHLKTGTNPENLRECTAKGRKARGDMHGSRLHPESRPRGDRSGLRLHPESVRRGERNHLARMTDADAAEIKRLYAEGGILQKQLAERFGTTEGNIYKILKGEAWAHIGGERVSQKFANRARGDRAGLRLHPERAAMGERNAGAKLTAEQVLEIRRLNAAGATQPTLAERFAISKPTISQIVRRDTWKHI